MSLILVVLANTVTLQDIHTCDSNRRSGLYSECSVRPLTKVNAMFNHSPASWLYSTTTQWPLTGRASAGLDVVLSHSGKRGDY